VIVFRASSAGEAAPAMLAHRQAASTPRRYSKHDHAGGVSRLPSGVARRLCCSSITAHRTPCQKPRYAVTMGSCRGPLVCNPKLRCRTRWFNDLPDPGWIAYQFHHGRYDEIGGCRHPGGKLDRPVGAGADQAVSAIGACRSAHWHLASAAPVLVERGAGVSVVAEFVVLGAFRSRCFGYAGRWLHPQ